MGNSLVAQRFIKLIKVTNNLPRLNWPLANKLVHSEERQLVPVTKITALIPYNMARRAPKAAAKPAVETEAAPSEQVESDSEQAVETKKTAAKSKKANGTEEKPKSTRGRKKDSEDVPEVTEAPKTSGRGRKKASTENDAPEVAEPPKARGKKSAKESETEDEPAKKTTRSSKKVEPAENGDEKPKPKGRKMAEVAPPSESPEKKARGGRKKKEDSSNDEEPEKKVAREKRGKMDAVAEEADGGSEEPEKLPAKRARKAVVKAQDDEVDEKPVKRGRKVKDSKEEKDAKPAKEKPTRSKRESPADSSDVPDSKKSKATKPETDLDNVDFGCDKTSRKGEKYNLKICSFNVASIRAIVAKKGLEYCLKEDADILVMQETKCNEVDLPQEWNLPGYKRYYMQSEKAGYAGVVLYTKKEPLNVQIGLESSPCNDEGRIITAEFDEFYVINVYVPNAGDKLKTLDKRLGWNQAFLAHVKELDEKKPVIICGDMNVSHQEIDLANPKANVKHAGFSPEERQGMTDLLGAGFVDTFRDLYPDKAGAYTFWTYFGTARARNIGWRLDYFIVSERIKDNICDNVIRTDVFGSDHCPIVLYAHL